MKELEKLHFAVEYSLTREDIITLLERIKKIGFDISLDTVGSPIIKDIICDKGRLVKKIDAKKIANNVDMIVKIPWMVLKKMRYLGILEQTDSGYS
ncbi:MAG: hypothetical protein V8R82_09980 [Clostridia bacterium]